jgi:RNA polymerase sigma-70 factor (ECF subfamily)
MESRVDPDVLLSRNAEPGQTAEAGELAERLRFALAALPAQQAEVFALCCVDKLSYGEVADRLQLTVNGVGVLLHRARQRLRGLLAPMDAKMGQED